MVDAPRIGIDTIMKESDEYHSVAGECHKIWLTVLKFYHQSNNPNWKVPMKKYMEDFRLVQIFTGSFKLEDVTTLQLRRSVEGTCNCA